MEQQMKEIMAQSIKQFHMPSYEQIPDVGLYLDQTVKYIDRYLQPLDTVAITGSMVSNYVKKGLLRNPVKKLYDREQIAYLFFISLAKSVLQLEDITLLIGVQQQMYSTEMAYDYLCDEMENVLQFVFGIKDTLDQVGVEHTDEKMLLRNTIIAVAHKVYLQKYIAALREKKA